MKELDILTLGVYTADADFKGFVSTTTSTVIAKYFANAYAKAPTLYDPVYCYAMRCKGRPFPRKRNVRREHQKWSKRRDAQNALVHNAEQGVAVAGGIGWGDVVGMRKIRVDQTGHFLRTGLLSDLLRKEYQQKLPQEQMLHGQKVKVWRPPPDDNAFDRLFELFSGRSQGLNHEIFWSYQVAPFSCPAALMAGREYIEEYRQKLWS